MRDVGDPKRGLEHVTVSGGFLESEVDVHSEELGVELFL